MDEKKVIETKLTEYENEQLKLLKSVFDMGCAFKMLALQKEANDLELKYLTEKRDFEYAQGQIGRFIAQVDLLKKELAKKESDTAREILAEAKKWVKAHYKDKVTDSFGEREMLFMEAFGCLFEYLKEKYGVDLGE